MKKRQSMESLYDVQGFFAETRELFQFLEQDYGYRWINAFLRNPEHGRDTMAQCRYASTRIGVVVGWYLADAYMGVSFAELQQPEELFPTSSYVSIYSLVEMLGVQNDPDLFLQNMYSSRKYNKRAKLIETSRRDIIAGLGRVTQKYADKLLKGDASIITKVMDWDRETHIQR